MLVAKAMLCFVIVATVEILTIIIGKYSPCFKFRGLTYEP